MADKIRVSVKLKSLDGDLDRIFALYTARPSIVAGRASKQSVALRAASNNARFESPIISREHAILECGDSPSKLLSVTDKGSLHGTWVNGRRLEKDKPRQLETGDLLQLGSLIVNGSTIHQPMRFTIIYVQDTPAPSLPQVSKVAEDTQDVDDQAPRVFRVPSISDSEDESPVEITRHEATSRAQTRPPVPVVPKEMPANAPASSLQTSVAAQASTHISIQQPPPSIPALPVRSPSIEIVRPQMQKPASNFTEGDAAAASKRENRPKESDGSHHAETESQAISANGSDPKPVRDESQLPLLDRTVPAMLSSEQTSSIAPSGRKDHIVAALRQAATEQPPPHPRALPARNSHIPRRISTVSARQTTPMSVEQRKEPEDARAAKTVPECLELDKAEDIRARNTTAGQNLCPATAMTPPEVAASLNASVEDSDLQDDVNACLELLSSPGPLEWANDEMDEEDPFLPESDPFLPSDDEEDPFEHHSSPSATSPPSSLVDVPRKPSNLSQRSESPSDRAARTYQRFVDEVENARQRRRQSLVGGQPQASEASSDLEERGASTRVPVRSTISQRAAQQASPADLPSGSYLPPSISRVLPNPEPMPTTMSSPFAMLPRPTNAVNPEQLLSLASYCTPVNSHARVPDSHIPYTGGDQLIDIELGSHLASDGGVSLSSAANDSQHSYSRLSIAEIINNPGMDHDKEGSSVDPVSKNGRSNRKRKADEMDVAQLPPQCPVVFSQDLIRESTKDAKNSTDSSLAASHTPTDAQPRDSAGLLLPLMGSNGESRLPSADSAVDADLNAILASPSAVPKPGHDSFMEELNASVQSSRPSINLADLNMAPSLAEAALQVEDSMSTHDGASQEPAIKKLKIRRNGASVPVCSSPLTTLRSPIKTFVSGALAGAFAVVGAAAALLATMPQGIEDEALRSF